MGAWSDGLEQHCLEPVLYVIYTYNLSEGALRLIGFILADARFFLNWIKKKFKKKYKVHTKFRKIFDYRGKQCHHWVDSKFWRLWGTGLHGVHQNQWVNFTGITTLG